MEGSNGNKFVFFVAPPKKQFSWKSTKVPFKCHTSPENSNFTQILLYLFTYIDGWFLWDQYRYMDASVDRTNPAPLRMLQMLVGYSSLSKSCLGHAKWCGYFSISTVWVQRWHLFWQCNYLDKIRCKVKITVNFRWGFLYFRYLKCERW